MACSFHWRINAGGTRSSILPWPMAPAKAWRKAANASSEWATGIDRRPSLPLLELRPDGEIETRPPLPLLEPSRFQRKRQRRNDRDIPADDQPTLIHVPVLAAQRLERCQQELLLGLTRHARRHVSLDRIEREQTAAALARTCS